MNQILTLISHVVKHSDHAMAIISALTRFLSIEHLKELIECLKTALSKAEQVDADFEALLAEEPSEPVPAADEPAPEMSEAAPAAEETPVAPKATWKPGKKS